MFYTVISLLYSRTSFPKSTQDLSPPSTILAYIAMIQKEKALSFNTPHWCGRFFCNNHKQYKWIIKSQRAKIKCCCYCYCSLNYFSPRRNAFQHYSWWTYKENVCGANYSITKIEYNFFQGGCEKERNVSWRLQSKKVN